MAYYIERDFPVGQLNPLARREASARRDIAMLHKWWARRVGCIFRTISHQSGNADLGHDPACQTSEEGR